VTSAFRVLGALGAAALASVACYAPVEVRQASRALSVSQAGGDAVQVEALDFAFGLSATTHRAGRIDFVVRNAGEVSHELVVVPFERGEYGTFLGEVDDVDPGQSKALRIDLPPGKYRLVCLQLSHLPDAPPESHLYLGMETGFEVTS